MPEYDLETLGGCVRLCSKRADVVFVSGAALVEDAILLLEFLTS